MSRYSTSAQYFGFAQWSILFLRSGFFANGIVSVVMGFSRRASSKIIVLVKPVPALPM